MGKDESATKQATTTRQDEPKPKDADIPQVIRGKNARLCEGPGCPLCTPFGLATYLVGFMVVLYTGWPYQLLGWATIALSLVQARWRIRWE
jgi:hypothetical protein